MTEWAFPRRRAVLQGALLSALLVPLSASASERANLETLEQLLAAFRKSPGLSACFVEDRHIALLKAPLKSEGALYFLPPHKLARHVERPRRSAVLLDGDSLQIADGEGTRRLDLKRHPALAALVQSFVQVLRGDRAALDRNYQVQFTSGDGAWHLRLVPLASPLSQMVKSLELSGAKLVIERLVVEEPNGDRTVTRFAEVDARRRFTAEERARLFSLPKR